MTKPEIRWRIIRGPWFDNMLSALEYGGRQARFSLKRTAPDAAPRLSRSAKPNSAELGVEPFDPLAGWVSAGPAVPKAGRPQAVQPPGGQLSAQHVTFSSAASRFQDSHLPEAHQRRTRRRSGLLLAGSRNPRVHGPVDSREKGLANYLYTQ